MSTPAGDAQARLSARMKEMRLAARLGGIEAGRRADPQISQSKISKMERQLLRWPPEDVRALCLVYGASAEETDQLERLARSLRTDVLVPSRVVLSRGARWQQDRIRQLEESAGLLRSFQCSMVIGLLQTPAYAGLVFGAGLPADEAGQAVEARMQRQESLRKRLTHAVLIMTEGALRWCAGSPQVMIEQLGAIAAAARLPNVEIRIIPYSAVADFFPRHGFHLYDSDAVLFGTETGLATITDGREVVKYEKLFGKLSRISVTGDDALAVLDRIAGDYRSLLRPPGQEERSEAHDEHGSGHV